MTRRAGRAPAFPAVALVVCLTLSGCSTPEADPEPASGVPEDYVSVHWVEREVRVHTLDRMFEDQDSAEVIANMGGTRERLFDIGIVVENEDGYTVEPDKDAWVDGVNLNQVDGALGNAMYHNEVTWCDDTVTGEEFVDAYMEEFWETLDSHKAYEESVIDYVDCGTGAP